MQKSKVLQGKLRDVKNLEKEIKILENLKKLFCELEKIDYETMKEILECKFADEIFDTTEDKIKKSKDKVLYILYE